MRNGEVSFWYAGDGLPRPRAPLPGPTTADVCIVGAGLTGLWAAWYLKQAKPELRVVVLERAFAGFGASGRNGGWLSDKFAASPDALAADHGAEAVHALKRAMRASIDEVIAVCEQEEIDAEIVRSGVLRVARTPSQAARLQRAVEHERRWDEDMVVLDQAALAARVRVAEALSGTWTPHGARVQPARLVRGLAERAVARGVELYEQTTATAIEPGRVRTDRGDVTAGTVLSCLEGFTPSLRGERRTLMPLNSAMVVTEPLPPGAWEEIGWQGEELLGDTSHAYLYSQRTADGRIAVGGRGIPYRFGSRTDRDGETQEWTARQLTALLHELFPAAAQVPIAHAWCGVLGVPRDWRPTVAYDAATGLGTAGGYVGNGLTTTNLAGRTLRDLVLGERTELTGLPWVGHAARRWEPEPLRWIGAQLVYALYRTADRREQRAGTGRTSGFARVADALAGRGR